MDEKELQKLYNAISAQFDVGDYNSFKSRMQTSEQRKSFYDVINKEGFDLGDYDSYEQRIGGVKKKKTFLEGVGESFQSGGQVGVSKAPSKGILSSVGKGATVKEYEPQDVAAYNKQFESITGAKDFSLREELSKVDQPKSILAQPYQEKKQKQFEQEKYQKYRDIEETVINPVLQKAFGSNVKGEELQTLAENPFGAKVTTDLVRNIVPESEGKSWEEIATDINVKLRPSVVVEQINNEVAFGKNLQSELSGIEAEKVFVSGGTGGAAASVSKTKLPQIDLNNPSEYGDIFYQINNADKLYDKDGKEINKEDLTKKLRAKLFLLVANEPLADELRPTSFQGNLQAAITRVNLSRERGKKIPTEQFAKDDTLNQSHVQLGLNYLKQADPNRYNIIMRGINEKQMIADLDFEELANIGQEIYNHQIFKEGAIDPQAIGKESNLTYDSYQTNRANLSLALGEKIKEMGYKRAWKVPTRIIDKAAQELASEGVEINPEILEDLKFSERIEGEGIPKGGVVRSFLRGVSTPIKGIEETARSLTMNPVDYYLESKRLDIGDQKVIDAKGNVLEKLPSERKNFFNNMVEGLGEFITQVGLARGIGAGLQRPFAALKGVSVSQLTRGQKINISAYGGGSASTFAQTFGGEFSYFYPKVGDARKAKLMSFFSSVGQSIIEVGILPDVKLAESARNLISGAAKKMATGLMGVIEKGGKEAAMPFINEFVKKVVSVYGKEVIGEEVSQQLFNYVTEAIFSPTTAGERDINDEVKRTISEATAKMVLPILLGAAGQAKQSQVIGKDALHTAAVNFQQYKDSFDKALIANQITQQEYDDVMGILNIHRESLNNVPKRDANGDVISMDRQMEYSFQDTISKINQEKADQQTDKVQKDFYSEKAKEADNLKRKIFYGEEIKELPKEEGEEPEGAESVLEGEVKDVDVVGKENLLDKAKEIAQSDVIKGYTKEALSEAAKNNPEQFETFLKEISEQAKDEKSLKTTIDTYGQELVDISQKLFPKETEPQEQKPSQGIVEGKEEVVGISKEDFDKHIIEQVENVKAGKRGFDWIIDIPGLDQKTREGAIKDIQEGKKTKRREQFEAAINDMYERGVVTIARGKGAFAESVEIPIQDWFSATPKEKEIADKVDVNTLAIIHENDITLKNIGLLKHLFDGFPYTEKDFQNVHDYLSSKIESSKETGRVSERSEEILPTKEEQREPVTEKENQGKKPERSVATEETSELPKAEEPQKPSQPIESQPPPKTPEPPKGKLPDDEGGRKKGVLTHLHEAKNIPEESRKGFESERLKYQTKNQEEAEKVAKSVIDEYGIDEAVRLSKEQMFDGDVNSLIFAESLNQIAEQERKATTEKDKKELADKFSEIGIEYDKMARYAGRFNAAIAYFYLKSPLGMVMKQNKQNKDDFDKWARGKNESWGEFLDRLNELPEFKDFVDKKVQDELKKERAEERKAKKEKVHKAIDDLTDKIAKALSIKGKDDIQKMGIGDFDAFMKGVSKAMKAAYDAGEHITKVIQDAIDQISSVVDGDWDIEDFRTKAEKILRSGEKKNALESYKDRLKKQIADLDRQIETKKRDYKRKEKTKPDKETEKLIKERDEKKKKLDEVAPLSENEEYQLEQLEKFRKKLKGLTEAQKDEVIRKSFMEIIKNGALKQADLRKIIAEATGRGDLTDEQSAKMKELVMQANEAGEVGKKLRERKATLQEYYEAQLRSAKAARELSDLFDKKSDYMKVIAASLQGATLSLTNVLLLNPGFNLINHLFLRLPNSAMQSVVGWLSGVKELNTVFSESAQKEFFKKLGLGTKESWVQFKTGMNRIDYDAKEIYTDQIRPMRSAKSIAHQIRSSSGVNKLAKALGGKEVERKEKLTGNQLTHRIFQIIPGTTAELVFRLMNFGDKPMRFAAGASTASAFANSLGLKFDTMDWKVFMEFPREEAYRILREKGLSEKQAADKADAIAQSIIQEGKRSTLQQENIFNDAINKLFGGKKTEGSGVASLAKATVVSPYIKIPSNAFWLYFNLNHPLIAIAQSTTHLLVSAAYRRKGDDVKAALQAREARHWAGIAALGIAYNTLVISMVKLGIIIPGSDPDDESKKEREGEQAYEKRGTLNITKLWAWIKGEDLSKIDKSFTINLKWFGSLGMLGNAISRDWEEMDDEQRENRNFLLTNLIQFWDTDDLKELNNSVFSNASGLLGALGEGGFKANRFAMNQINLYANLLHPAAFASVERNLLPYYTDKKADSFGKELDNSLLERSWIYRKLSGRYPPMKYNIWGEPAMKDSSFWFRMLGFNRVTKDNFAQPIYEDAKKYNDIDFFPPALTNKIGGIELTAQQQSDRQQFIGRYRKTLVGAFINDQMPFPEVDKFYSQLSKEEKVAALKFFYSYSKELGDEDLFKKYPELRIHEKTEDQKEADKLFSDALKEMKISLKERYNIKDKKDEE